MSSQAVQQQAAALIPRIKSLVNNDLKRILKEEGKVQSGVKITLQTRVIDMIELAVDRNDLDTFNRIRYRVHNGGAAPPVSAQTSPAPVYSTPPSRTASNGFDMTNGSRGAYGSYQTSQPLPHRPQPIFKESPFFEIRELIQGGIVLESSPSHRQSVQRYFTLNDAVCSRLRNDPALRLLLFSSMEEPLQPYTRRDIAFPSQIEVRVNNDEVKANYKGLKNKPGSTRPADLTSFVRTSPANYKNSLHITYALTQKKYTLYVYMAKKYSVEDLAKRIQQRNLITKDSVISELLKKANDPDIVVGSSVMSLKDPISTLRISLPCRSTICTHNQCFDAESFLQLQEQAPTWQCPICNKTIAYEGLAVDQYVQEILDSVSRGTDQVTIEPNGQWVNTQDQPTGNGYNGAADDSDDDDLVEISDYRLTAIKTEATQTPQSLSRTPPLPSREASLMSRAGTTPRGTKRTSEVIDLTLSDEDEPPRPAKKVAYNTPSSLQDPSRRYQLPSYGSSTAPVRPPSHSHTSMSPGLRMDQPSPSQSHHSYAGAYRPPPPRPSFPGQGTSTYPTYLDSSP